MKTLQVICLILTIIGAVNWGLVGLFDLDLVAATFGVDSAITTVVYSIVGIAGIINLGLLFKMLEESKRKQYFLNKNKCLNFVKKIDKQDWIFNLKEFVDKLNKNLELYYSHLPIKYLEKINLSNIDSIILLLNSLLNINPSDRTALL